MRLLRALLTTMSFVVAIAPPAAAQDVFRPPAIPLITHDPYFSIWSTADRLTDRPTSHWTGTPHPMSALVRIDGRAFRIMGHLPANVAALTQRSVTVLPLRTIYVFDGAGIELTLTFLSPMLPHDLELVSRPASYVTFQARATDGRAHDVAIYFDASSQIAVNSPNQPVTWDASRDDDLERMRVGSAAQPVLAKDGDNLRIDWGSLYVAAPKASGTTTRIARDVDAERSFVDDRRAARRRHDGRAAARRRSHARARGRVLARPRQRHAGVPPRHRGLRRRMVGRVPGRAGAAVVAPQRRRRAGDAARRRGRLHAPDEGERGLRHRADARPEAAGRRRLRARRGAGLQADAGGAQARRASEDRRAALLLEGELQQRLHGHRRRHLSVVSVLPALRARSCWRRSSGRCSSTPRRRAGPSRSRLTIWAAIRRPTARSMAAARRPRRTRCRSRSPATCC